MEINPYIYPIEAFSNYDGDSFDLTLDLGFALVAHHKCRIYGIDTPELRGGTADSKAAGYLARDKAREWVHAAMDRGGAYFCSENYAGKFGRPLGDIVDMQGRSLRRYLIANGYGVEYHGQAKAEIAAKHDENIAALKKEGLI